MKTFSVILPVLLLTVFISNPLFAAAPAEGTMGTPKGGRGELVAEAKKEGKVFVYGNIGPSLKKGLVGGFQAKFGLRWSLS